MSRHSIRRTVRAVSPWLLVVVAGAAVVTAMWRRRRHYPPARDPETAPRGGSRADGPLFGFPPRPARRPTYDELLAMRRRTERQAVTSCP